MKRTMKQCCILALAACLLFVNTGCMCAYLTYQKAEEILTTTPVPTRIPEMGDLGTPSPERGETHFRDMVYTAPDLAALQEEAQALLERAGQEGATQEVLSCYETLLEQFNAASDQMSMSYLLYALDVTEETWQDTYAEIHEGILALDVTMTDLSVALLEDETHSGAARAAWGADFSDTVLREQDLNSLEIQELLKQEQEITFKYDALIGSYQYWEDGRGWTLEGLGEAYYAAEISYEDYLRLYDAYTDGLNREAGAIFLELVQVRNRIAADLGYGSYAAYSYDCYGRDYTLQEAGELHQAVKELLVPLYQSAVSQSAELYLLNQQSFGLEGFLATLQQVTGDFAPEVQEALNYMLRNGLYDFEETDEKMEGAFTTYLGAYEAPFILSHWTGSAQDVRTVIHELGHFTHYYYAGGGGWSCNDPLDLAEVDSQGLELLLSSYDNFFFGRNVNAATLELLNDAMYAVISGCMEDEFQQEVYGNPDMTLEQMNDLYLGLAKEYGFYQLYGYTGKEWVMIPHTFQSPLYYISYATSMVMALELWQEGQADFDAAREAYLSVLKRPAYSEFRKTALETGLMDPLSREAVEGIAKALEKRIFDN